MKLTLSIGQRMEIEARIKELEIEGNFGKETTSQKVYIKSMMIKGRIAELKEMLK